MIVQVIKLVRKKQEDKAATIIFRVAIIVMLLISVCISSSIAVYLYFVETGLKKYCSNNDQTASWYIEKALAMNNMIHKAENMIGPLNIAMKEEIAMRLCLAHQASFNKDSTRAIEEYLNVLKLDNNSYMARRNVANLFFLTRHYEQAIYQFQKLVQMTPPELNGSYYLDMGKAYIILQNKDKAIENLNKALEYGEDEEVISTYLQKARKTDE